MGAFLSNPKTEKLTDSGEGMGLRYGVSAMQGWRVDMEDAHLCDVKQECCVFGVFDGHAGASTASKSSEKLMEHIKKLGESKNEEDIKKTMRDGFLKLDEWLQKEVKERSGTTAVVSSVLPDKIVFSNCGDSRGLLCRDREIKFATVDHKPYNDVERDRIMKAGGTVMMQRVNGSLAVSRALGDFDYKRVSELGQTEQMVSPEPETTVLERDLEKDQFVLLACDGIFDVMDNEAVKDFILTKLELTSDLTQICSELIDICLHKNSRDNMTAILITFPGAPKVSEEAKKKHEERMEKITKRIEELLKEIAEKATDSMDLDSNQVFAEILSQCAEEHEVYLKKEYITSKANQIRKEKFGIEDENSFSREDSDPSSLSGQVFESHGFGDSPMEDQEPPSLGLSDSPIGDSPGPKHPDESPHQSSDTAKGGDDMETSS